MNINDLTIGQFKQLSNLISFEVSEEKQVNSAYKIGTKYFIRTATYHCVGLLIEKTKGELILEDASWIADSGRLNNALKTGIFDEIEPFPNNLIVNISGIIDATAFDHDLPSEVK